MNAPCPLCEGSNSQPFFADAKREWSYQRCPNCELIWMERDCLPTAEVERAHYGLHENDSGDSGYRQFLDRLWLPLRAKLPANASGLDYGSGPGPTLHLMAAEAGFPMAHYDPIFHPDQSALSRRYDFVTCSETAEHFHSPANEFARLATLLEPGGWLGVMTTRYEPNINFANWHYRHDPTHVAFYTERTFRIIAQRHGFASVEFPSATVCLLQRGSSAPTTPVTR